MALLNPTISCPQGYLVETGDGDAEALVNSQHDAGVDLFGATRDEYRWHAREGTGIGAEHVVRYGQRDDATCPAGKTSRRWSPVQNRRSHPVVNITCAVQNGGPAPHRHARTRDAGDVSAPHTRGAPTGAFSGSPDCSSKAGVSSVHNTGSSVRGK
jgi:hypothetical protein